MKILTVVGARPQLVKAAVVSRVIAARNLDCPKKQIKEVIVHTDQHYDENMSGIFFSEMHIPLPRYNLGINGCSHGAMTGRMLEQIERVIWKEKPTMVVVYGDTNSTLAGALAAAKLGYPVAHVEAGLRSFNMNMPEEINRVLTDRISRWLFCPTEASIHNLKNEGIVKETGSANAGPVPINVGDVMYDATLFYRRVARPSKGVEKLLRRLGGDFYVATVHRAENTDDVRRLLNILNAFSTISHTTPIVWPIHPRTRKIVAANNLSLDGITVVDPVGYLDMILLLEHCKAVFTDSGGLQKEAYFFQKPCITLRDETEWVELVVNGHNRLVGANTERIMEAEKEIEAFDAGPMELLYGSGNAAEKIIETLVKSHCS